MQKNALEQYIRQGGTLELCISLYLVFGLNESLKTRIQANRWLASSYRVMMDKELHSIMNIQKVKPKALPFITEQQQQQVSAPKTIQHGIYTSDDYDQLPDDVKNLVHAGKRLFKESSYLHQKLNVLFDKRELAIAVHTLLDKDDEKEKIFAQVDFYKLHKKLPIAEVVCDFASMSQKELMNKRAALRTFISRNKQVDSKIAEVAKAKEELEALKKYIDGIDK